MHEISLLEEVVKIALSKLKGQGPIAAKDVKAISIEVGALELHSIESFRQAFKSLAAGTLLSEADLKVSVVPARIECISCGFKGPCEDDHVDHHDPMPCVACPRCHELTPLSGGRGVDKISLTLDETPAVP